MKQKLEELRRLAEMHANGRHGECAACKKTTRKIVGEGEAHKLVIEREGQSDAEGEG